MAIPLLPFTFLLFCLLSWSTAPSIPMVVECRRLFSPAAAASAAAAGTRTRGASNYEYMTLKPRQPRHKKRHIYFRGREIGSCKPKGFRPPPSAPSRYANYHTLGSKLCAAADQKRTTP